MAWLAPALLCLTSAARAETYLGAYLGYQTRSVLEDPIPDAGGRFEHGAPVFSGTAHWSMPRFESLQREDSVSRIA